MDGKIIDLKIKGVFSAFGDFNSDKLTDIFVIKNEGASFAVYLAKKHHPYIENESNIECFINQNRRIVLLIPSDFTGKACMDVIVVAIDKDNRDGFLLYLVEGNKMNLSCNTLTQDNYFAKVKHHPLLLDYNGDMISDLLAYDSDANRYIYSHTKERNWNKTQIAGDEIKSPNSNAFVDLNGDYLTDMFIEGKKFEYWYNQNGEFKKNLEIDYPKGYKVVGASSFIDVNSNGEIDHIVPVCKDEQCFISSIVAYNRKKSEWETITEHFPLSNGSSEIGFVPQLEIDDLIFPLKMRHADIDGNGYLDFVTLMRFKNLPYDYKVIVLMNVRNSSNSFGRSFIPYLIDIMNINSAPVLATFFDVEEDAKPDIFFVMKIKNSNSMSIYVSMNSQMIDACFLKVLVTTGICYSNCPVDDSTISLTSTVPYGTNQPGPTISYQLKDIEGYERKGLAGQLSQSSDFALQMPYSIFGLGPNFVDNLTASIPGFKQRVASWLGIVPDAQVVVIPYPPLDSRLWRTKLFITPSNSVILTVITLGCICFVLIVIIFILHRKEAYEDLAEHEEYKRHWPDCR